MKNKINTEYPRDGLAGLKAHWVDDLSSGFVVFLLALPLSLGIAKASDFPPLMGLVTAIIGGLVVSFFMGSRLSIKGPAAGLIVIVAGAVADFGGGEIGWHLALGAMVVAGLVQILFGVFRLGKLVDFFPLSTIHGMLAAIGIIIIAKQVPVLLDINPAVYQGMSPVDLILRIPDFVVHLDPKATLIGVISLWVMMGWKNVQPVFLRKVPAPLVVLLIAIPGELILDFQHTEPPYALVHIGNLMESVRYNADFSGFLQTGTFVKYVVMFALVGSLESLLTVKAVDLLDPWKRKSNANKDLIATGIGNTLAALIGGLPMISEVARSSANVANGAKTRWSNFFHAAFLLGFVLLAVHLIELIPNTALAAMLITVGIRLAHPREFVAMLRIGWEQLAVFTATILFTLFFDLLVGILAGMLLQMIMHVLMGTPIRSFFKSITGVSFVNGTYVVEVQRSAIFTNYLGIKRKLESIPPGMSIRIDMHDTKVVDNSVLENLDYFKHDYELAGGTVEITGLEQHRSLSSHHFSAKVK